MDPLIADGFHNLTYSPLCRLPEEVLLDIMKRLDLGSIQCLRRVSRLFLRIYSSPTFSSSYIIGRHLASYEHWYEPTDESYEPWCKKLSILLNKDVADYCEDCRRRRLRQGWTNNRFTTKYLHCSGCNIDHPACLFSKTQRSRPPKARMCIGREGFVRLCQHKVVTWDDVIWAGLELGELDTDNSASVFLNKCEHESHFPVHRKKDTSLLNHQSGYPVINISGYWDSGVTVNLKWHGHLNLPNIGFDKEGYNEIATPTLIRQQLEKFRQGTAEFIAPEFSPGRLTEMNLFDPNRCSCLRYVGVEQLPSSWQLTPWLDSTFRACRRYPDSRLGPLRCSKIDSQEDGQKRIQSHTIDVSTTGSLPSGTSFVRVRIEPCPVGSRCLQILYGRDITIIPEGYETNHITWVWCQAVDPDSYNLTDDDESFGLLWCRQLGCKNYYKYLKKSPFPLEDTNRACRKSCPSK